MKGAKGLYFGATNAVLAPVSFVHRRRRRYDGAKGPKSSPTPPLQSVDAYLQSITLVVNHVTTKRKEVDHIPWVLVSVPRALRARWSPAIRLYELVAAFIRSNYFSTTTVRRRSSSKKNLKLLKELTQDEELVESDKNLGWSLNTPFWYNMAIIWNTF